MKGMMNDGRGAAYDGGCAANDDPGEWAASVRPSYARPSCAPQRGHRGRRPHHWSFMQ